MLTRRAVVGALGVGGACAWTSWQSVGADAESEARARRIVTDYFALDPHAPEYFAPNARLIDPLKSLRGTASIRRANSFARVFLPAPEILEVRTQPGASSSEDVVWVRAKYGVWRLYSGVRVVCDSDGKVVRLEDCWEGKELWTKESVGALAGTAVEIFRLANGYLVEVTGAMVESFNAARDAYHGIQPVTPPGRTPLRPPEAEAAAEPPPTRRD
jgi:hypothetical protein